MTLYDFVAGTDVDLGVTILRLKGALGIVDQACGAAFRSDDDGEAANLARLGDAISDASGLLQEMLNHYRNVEAES